MLFAVISLICIIVTSDKYAYKNIGNITIIETSFTPDELQKICISLNKTLADYETFKKHIDYTRFKYWVTTPCSNPLNSQKILYIKENFCLISSKNNIFIQNFNAKGICV